MKNKKLVSLFLAVAMVLVMAVPAFASNDDNGNTTTTARENSATSATQQTDFTGETVMYNVKITITPSNKLIVNPYKIAVNPQGFEEAVSDQIITPATFITNETNVALKASATITVRPEATVSLLDSLEKVNQDSGEVQLGTFTPAVAADTENNIAAVPAKWAPKTKQVTPEGATDPQTQADITKYVPKAAFLAFEMINTTDNETQPTTWKKAEEIPANDVDSEGVVSGKTIVLAEGPNTLTDCLELAAVEEGGDPNYAAFHFTGLVNIYPSAPDKAPQDPKTADVTGDAAANYPTKVTEAPWTETDTISTSVVLTFTPKVDVKDDYETPSASATTPATPATGD